MKEPSCKKLHQEKPDLKTIKTLSMLKLEKCFRALEKGYLRQPYTNGNHTRFLIERLKDETKELKTALEEHRIQDMLEELADISNFVDFLFEQITSFLWNQKGDS